MALNQHVMAGAGGIEPPNAGIKIRTLTLKSLGNFKPRMSNPADTINSLTLQLSNRKAPA
jgi:hypothetical protein